MIKDNLDFNQSVKPNTEFLEQLRQKLPEFFTSSDSDKEAEFDMEKFQKALKEQNVEELSSGYQLDFIGKNYAKKQAGERPTTVIVPDNEHNEKIENKDSKNLFFTGDNLEVLRHLQQNYAKSVDFIYIDPPYNTGSDGFVYPDKFEYSDEQLQDMFNLNDEELKRMKSIQGKSTHSAWLTFMYPRLYLAKKLLKDSGVIFISIDDNEQANLKLLMDEVFGEGSFIGNIAWESKTKSQNTRDAFDKLQPRVEHIFVYEKKDHRHFNLVVRDHKKYDLTDNKGVYREKLIEQMSAQGIRGRETMVFPIIDILPQVGNQWKWGQDTISKYELRGDLFKKGDKLYIKIRPEDERTEQTEPFWAYISKGFGTAESAKKEVKRLFKDEVFDTVKPVNLIKKLLFHGTKKDALVVDFFAGTATTAHAVLELNAEDEGDRRYIMVQLSEPTKPGSVAHKAGYTSIDQISRARIEKAAEKIKSDNPLLTEIQDFGFKNYYVVEPSQQTLDQLDFDNDLQLDIFDDMISAFSSEKLGVEGQAEGFDTILQTYMVSDGYKFDTSVEMLEFAGVKLPYVNKQRIYLITNDWTAQNTKALVNAIGKNEISVQTIIVYGYTIDMESLRELEIALNQLENKVHLLVRY